MTCPFCTPPACIVKENDLAVLIHDAYPVSPGHSLIIPQQNMRSWFEATQEECTIPMAKTLALTMARPLARPCRICTYV